jgi:F-type H+-transporting ATPase subunit alpha
MSKALRLELAQYQELLGFSQFGNELDIVSQKRLARGALAYELLKQKQFVTYTFVDEAIMLFLLRYNILDKLALNEVNSFVIQFVSFVQSVHRDFYNEILNTGVMSEENINKLLEISKEFSSLFIHV